MKLGRFGRLLSLALIPLGLLIVPFALLVGDTVALAIGFVAVGTGVTFYWKADVIFDPNAEFDLQSGQTFVSVLAQLGMSLVLFGLFVYLVGDVRAMTSLFRTGVSSPAAATVGAVAGVFLGGGADALAQRSTAFPEWGSPFRILVVGSSLSLGAFLTLLLVQPPASLIYAVVYTLSRLAVAFGVYLRS